MHREEEHETFPPYRSGRCRRRHVDRGVRVVGACLRRRARNRCRAGLRSAVLRTLDRQDQVLPVACQEGALPHRARQRLHRQHLAHPDDPDRQGLRRATGHRGQAQGIQGRLDRRGRRRADRRGQQFHRFRLRRDHRERPEPRPHSSRSSSAPRKPASCWSPFDNMLDTEDAINVDVDQKGLGVYWAQWLDKHLPNGGKMLEVRGVSGTSVDRDRHDGIHETLDKTGKKWDVVEVYGKWDDPTAQKVTADAIAVQKHFDGYRRAGRRHRRGAGDDRRQAAIRAVRRRDRERLPQVLLPSSRTGPEMRVRRHRAGAGGGRDKGRDSPRSRARSCRSRSSCRSRPPKIRTSRTARTIIPSSATISSSATPSRPATSISARLKSWDSRRRTSNDRQTPPAGALASRRLSRGRRVAAPWAISRGKGWRRERSGVDGLADPADGGRFQALRRRARARQRGSHRVRGTHPRHPRRERRGQVHADQDDVRRRAAGRGTMVLDGAEVAFDSPAAANAPASSASSRNCRSFPTFRSPTTSPSPTRRAASA